MSRTVPVEARQEPIAHRAAETPNQARQQASEQTLCAIATPTPRSPDHRVRTQVDHLTQELAAACLASRDPHRALAGAAGALLQLQSDLVPRSKNRPSREQEQAVAPPHQPKPKRR